MDMTIMTGFEPEEFLRIVADHRRHGRADGPTMFVRLLALPAQGALRYDSPRCTGSCTPPRRVHPTSSAR